MSRLRPAALLLAVLSVALMILTALVPAPASAAASATSGRALLVFLPVRPPTGVALAPGDPGFDQPSILSVFNAEPTLALGLSSATQGTYKQAQALLDITQGTRVSTSTYVPVSPPALTFFPFEGGGLFQGFLDAKDRAGTAPADIEPGLLGQTVPGGTGYAGVEARDNIEALAAVNEAGRISEVSLGKGSTLAGRALDLLTRKRFVVVGLPTGQLGVAQLDQLLAERPKDTLVLTMQSPPLGSAPHLLPTGAAGLGHVGALTSTTTHLDGIVAGIDILPTVLTQLGVKVPSTVKGQEIRVEGAKDQDALESFTARLRIVGPQRFPILEAMLAAWILVLLLGGLIADRRGFRLGVRVGALAGLWILPMLLVTAKIAPAKGTEVIIVVLGTFGLAFLCDRVLPWPRAPLIPCGVAIAAYAIDLFFGSELTIRSVLGSNPLFGSRFYGIGNELEAALPVLLFIGLAAFLDRRPKSRGMVMWFAFSSLFLGAVIGSGRLGADVGGVITIGGGAAVAVLFALPGGVTKRAVSLAVLVPIGALVLLAVLDTATGGNGHFTRTVLHANGESAIQDIVVRRFELAGNVFLRGLMPFATLIALLAAAYVIRYRARVLGPLEGRAGWNAALAGALASSIVGSLANDSGPLLLVIGVSSLAFVIAYVRGDPRLAGAPASVAAPELAAQPEIPLPDR